MQQQTAYTYKQYQRETIPLLKYKFSEDSMKWQQLRNKYAGKRCFIIGNGPSLKQQNLTVLKDEITFVSNWFVLHQDYEKINPNYYCICAHEVFGTPSNSYVSWYKNVKFEPKLYKLLQEKAKQATKIFPFFFKQGIREKKLFSKDESLLYLFFEPPTRAIDKVNSINLDIANHKIDSGETVIINFCLPVAYYLGFKEIYLLGCDCDYGIKKPGDTRNYFYDFKKQSGTAPSFEWLQKSWASDGSMINSYKVVKKEFEKRQVKIYNATEGGKLEVFPRVKFESLFS